MNNCSLVIFTCENREHLLQKSYVSFLAACDFKFDRIILAIDGRVDPVIIAQINPDITLYQHNRRGYVSSISKTLKLIDTPWFFWLEDDWAFHQKIDVNYQISLLTSNPDWCQILYSQWFPLKEEYKILPAGDNLYQTPFGFSANPCLCNTTLIQSAFRSLEVSPKGDKLGEHGFENFLTEKFKKDKIKSIIINPTNDRMISHEGYLESTPRNWHMTNSLEKKTEKHLLIMPEPPLWRKLFMIFKLAEVFTKLSFKQLASNEIYEFCFRIISSVKSIGKDD